MRRSFKLGRDFYTRADALQVARELLGKRLVVPTPTGERVSGRIVAGVAQPTVKSITAMADRYDFIGFPHPLESARSTAAMAPSRSAQTS